MRQERVKLLAKLTTSIYAAQITACALHGADFNRAMRDAKEIIRIAELEYPNDAWQSWARQRSGK